MQHVNMQNESDAVETQQALASPSCRPEAAASRPAEAPWWIPRCARNDSRGTFSHSCIRDATMVAFVHGFPLVQTSSPNLGEEAVGLPTERGPQGRRFTKSPYLEPLRSFANFAASRFSRSLPKNSDANEVRSVSAPHIRIIRG
jgi:hypothetical protein